MSEINNARKNYIFSKKIELNDDDYIVLREPTAFEAKDFDEDGKSNLALLYKLLPKCIIEHSFLDGGIPAKKEAVAAMLLDSLTYTTKIVEEWMSSLPLAEKSKGSLPK